MYFSLALVPTWKGGRNYYVNWIIRRFDTPTSFLYVMIVRDDYWNLRQVAHGPQHLHYGPRRAQIAKFLSSSSFSSSIDQRGETMLGCYILKSSNRRRFVTYRTLRSDISGWSWLRGDGGIWASTYGSLGRSPSVVIVDSMQCSCYGPTSSNGSFNLIFLVLLIDWLNLTWIFYENRFRTTGYRNFVWKCQIWKLEKWFFQKNRGHPIRTQSGNCYRGGHWFGIFLSSM